MELFLCSCRFRFRAQNMNVPRKDPDLSKFRGLRLVNYIISKNFCDLSKHFAWEVLKNLPEFFKETKVGL